MGAGTRQPRPAGNAAGGHCSVRAATGRVRCATPRRTHLRAEEVPRVVDQLPQLPIHHEAVRLPARLRAGIGIP